MNAKTNTRIVSLDWLRGLMALSIMFYHLSDFTVTKSIPLDSSNVLGRLGIYGVSVFFILSGLSMAIVYNNFFKNQFSVVSFFTKRIFRIWPLLWVVCILKVLFSEYITNSIHYNWQILFLNFTTLFGFIKPTAYIAMGAWSIGNEMVYYLLTPIIIFLFERKKIYGNLLFLVNLIIGFVFSELILKKDQSLASQWSTYVNPFNNFFLYNMGIAIYYNLKKTNIPQKTLIISLLASVFLFCYAPFSGDLIKIVSGPGRFLFVVISFITVTCFYKLTIKLPEKISRFFESLGFATYGIYLIHPIIYLYLNSLLNSMNIENKNILLFLVPIITIPLSLMSYHLFETKMMKLGKKVAFNLGIEKTN